VNIEAVQLILDGVGSVALNEDAGMLERDHEVSQRSTKLVARLVHRSRADTSRKVLVEKTLDMVICQISNRKPVLTRPVCEMGDTVQVLPYGLISVSLAYQFSTICRNEGSKVTVA
jgi:hypothetical protein